MKAANIPTPAARVASRIGTTGGGGEVEVAVATTVVVGAEALADEGSVNPVAYLKARMLKGALDFFWPDTPTLSSHFLLAKTEEETLGVTSAALAAGPTSIVG